MKFVFKSKPPKQYEPVFVDCSDQVMGELLSIAYEIKNRPNTQTCLCLIEEARKSVTANKHLFDFYGGAKLSVVEGGFSVFGYAFDGSDTLEALEELNTYHALRKAKYHFKRSRARSMINTATQPDLKIQVVMMAPFRYGQA